MRILIDIDEKTSKVITKSAADAKTFRKPFTEFILEFVTKDKDLLKKIVKEYKKPDDES